MGSFATFAETKTERTKEVLEECTWDNEHSSSELFGKRVTNSGVWTLQKIHKKLTLETHYVLVIHLLNKEGGQWWVKDLSVDCHPYCYDCPRTLVKEWYTLNEGNFINKYEKEWYEKWTEYEDLYQSLKKIKSGDQVQIGSRVIAFKYWSNKSKSKFVGHEASDPAKLFQYRTQNVTEVLNK
jgi:hypothetical protein